MKEPKDREYYLKDARNIVWGVGFIGFLPLFVMLIMVAAGIQPKWDIVTFSMSGISFFLTSVAIYAGILCRKGLKTGKTLAMIPAVLLLFYFPLGTIFSIATMVKLNKKKFVDELI